MNRILISACMIILLCCLTHAADSEFDVPRNPTRNVAGIVDNQTPHYTVQQQFEIWDVRLELARATLQGHFVQVDLLVDGGTESIGGFDFLIGFNDSALTFTEAVLGYELQTCGWEDFSYQYIPNDNCGDNCPSGLIRLTGRADIDNGAVHPDQACLSELMNRATVPKFKLATLTFFVSSDRRWECWFLPIRFYWMDCSDNVIRNFAGDTMAVNRHIYRELHGDLMEDYAGNLPGYTGTPDACLGGVDTLVRLVDLRNGGVDLVCNVFDCRGDINANKLHYEIGDAAEFAGYFVSGLAAFKGHIEASICGSDVNRDGIALGVADFVALVRIVNNETVGIADTLQPPIAHIKQDGRQVIIESEEDLGAVWLIFETAAMAGTPEIELDMEMKYTFANGDFRIFVYSLDSRVIPAGERHVVTVPDYVSIVRAEAATYDGRAVETQLSKTIPFPFEMSQNYPNPFNRETVIELSLKTEADWVLHIYNVSGREIRTLSGYDVFGIVRVTWDGTDAGSREVASGIYYYRVVVDGWESETKMMVLVK